MKNLTAVVKTITFKVVDWLPCDTETAQNRTPPFGQTTITENNDGFIDSVITTFGNKIMAQCSADYVLPEPFDEFVFEKK